MTNIDIIDLECDENLYLEDEIDMDINNNIFYSYPFKEDDEFEYQYRITLENGVCILDEIKCNDECEIIEEGLVLINNITKIASDELRKNLKNNIDIRNGKEFPKNNPVNLNDIPININNQNELKKLELAKTFCIKELFDDILPEL